MDNVASPSNILVVDHDRDCLLLLVNMLESAGYRVRPLRDWEMALPAIHSERPDVVLLDAAMPGMNIDDACRQLKTDEQAGEILLILLSASDTWTYKVSAFAAGVTDYLTKPLIQEEVLGRIRAHLSARTQSRDSHTQPVAT